MTTVHSAALTLRSLLGAYRLLLWVAAGVAVAAAVLGLVFDVLGGTIEHSVWEHAGTPARWMLFGVGLTITPLLLPTYVSHGITRRAFTLGAAAGAGLLIAFVAFYLAAGFLVERAVFDATDRAHDLAGTHLFTGADQVHLVTVEYGLAVAGYLLGGWLIGTGYYRFGALRGTLLAPVGLLPAALVDNALGTGQWLGLGPPTLGWLTPDLPLAAAVSSAVVVLLAGMAVLYNLTRTASVHSGSR